MGTFDDISGGKFGMLLVIGRTEDHIRKSGKRETQYTCVCECGNIVKVTRKNLVSGHTKTCGCRGGEERREYGSCFYFPHAIDCNNPRKCSTCGWNPSNTKLRKARINKLLRKDGKYE